MSDDELRFFVAFGVFLLGIVIGRVAESHWIRDAIRRGWAITHHGRLVHSHDREREW